MTVFFEVLETTSPPGKESQIHPPAIYSATGYKSTLVFSASFFRTPYREWRQYLSWAAINSMFFYDDIRGGNNVACLQRPVNKVSLKFDGIINRKRIVDKHLNLNLSLDGARAA